MSDELTVRILDALKEVEDLERARARELMGFNVHESHALRDGEIMVWVAPDIYREIVNARTEAEKIRARQEALEKLKKRIKL